MFPLPVTYRHEQALLEGHRIRSWSAVAALDDAMLDRMSREGLATLQRLRRLRGQARLVDRVGLDPAEAALLLHAGIADPRGLAASTPEGIVRQVGRLERRLKGGRGTTVTLQRAGVWITAARRSLGVGGPGGRAGRPGN